MKKKLLAVLLAGTMTVTLGACGGASDSGSTSDDAAATEAGDAAGDDAAASTTGSKDAIRFMNTKIEIDTQLKEFAKQYQEK